MLRMSLTG